MRNTRLRFEILVASLLIIITVSHDLAASRNESALIQAKVQIVDSTTVDHLSRDYLGAPATSLRATTDVTGTLAATLAAELLLSSFDQSIYLPLISK